MVASSKRFPSSCFGIAQHYGIPDREFSVASGKPHRLVPPSVSVGVRLERGLSMGEPHGKSCEP